MKTGILGDDFSENSSSTDILVVAVVFVAMVVLAVVDASVGVDVAIVVDSVGSTTESWS